MVRSSAPLLLALMLLPAIGRAQDNPLAVRTEPVLPEYTRAKGLLEQGEFDAAVEELQKGLAEPDVTDDQLADLYQLLGLAELYLGDQDKAREAFEKLLQARPDYELPRSEPPKIRALYARIKEDIKHRRVLPVTLEVQPLGTVTQGQPLVLHARVENLALGARPHLFYRRAGSQAFSSIDFRHERGTRERFTAMLGPTDLPVELAPYEIEYYVEVTDAANRRLAGAGDAFDPMHFKVVPPEGAPVAAEESTPWYKNPWVWVIGGAVTVGAGVGIVALATSKQTGTLTIRIAVNP